MSAPTQTPSAVDLEREVEQQRDRANAERLSAQREVARLEADIAAAQSEMTRAIRDQISGVQGSERRVEAADKAVQSATRRRALAEQRTKVALDLARDSETRLERLRAACLSELCDALKTEHAEALSDAQSQLDATLRKYVAVYGAYRASARRLELACAVHVRELDRERGEFRSESKVKAESTSPTCPVSPALLSAILSGSPLPLVLRDGYAADKPLAAYGTVRPIDDPDALLQPLSPNDPRYDRRHRGPDRAEVAEAIAVSSALRGSL